MSLFERASRRTRVALPACALLCIVALQTSGFSWTEWARNRAFDALLQAQPREWTDAGVRVIDIDDESLARLGQWPWPRTQVARLERRLQELGVAVTAYDVFFSEPDRTSPRRVASQWTESADAALKARLERLPDHDAVLAATLAKGRGVLGFTLVSERNAARPALKARWFFSGEPPLSNLPDFPGAVGNLPVLEKAASGLGSVSLLPDPDFVIRSAPLLFRLDASLYPSFSLETLRVAQGAPTIAVKTAGGSGEKGGRTGIVAIKVGAMTIPTDRDGRVRVYYSRRAAERTISAWRLFDKGFDATALEGAIALVGTSAMGLKDLRATPIDEATPGVEVHANVLEQAITNTFLERPDWALGAEVVCLLVLGALLLLVLERAGALWSAPLAAFAVAGSMAFSWHAFSSWRLLVDPLFPPLGLAVVYAAWTAISFVRTELDKRRITRTFGRYLSPKVVAKLAEKHGDVELGGETREMTFHFCDIRGFTTISEKFDPHGLTVFINNFLTPMTEVILQHDGTIDKYMGDCIMAFWNAPMDVPKHAEKACAAALAMHARLKELNARWQAEAAAAGRSIPLIEIGTGLNTGPCVVGNMGSTLRVDYTVLGDDVNLASRLEGQSKSYGVDIVIGPVTRERAPAYAALELDLIKVKGKTSAVRIFTLLGDPAAAGTSEFLALKEKHDAMLAAYRAQRWDEAEGLLKELEPLGAPWRLGKLHKLYAERLAAYRAEPPGAAWDGVFVATSK